METRHGERPCEVGERGIGVVPPDTARVARSTPRAAAGCTDLARVRSSSSSRRAAGTDAVSRPAQWASVPVRDSPAASASARSPPTRPARPARPEDDPERRPGEAQPRVGSPDPVVAGGHQVGTGADGRALDDRHRGERCLEQPLQQQPDPQEAVRQPRVVLVVEAVEVEPAAEVPAAAHAGRGTSARSAIGTVEPGVQALDQVGRQRVGAVGPVELESTKVVTRRPSRRAPRRCPRRAPARRGRAGLGTPPMRAG